MINVSAVKSNEKVKRDQPLRQAKRKSIPTEKITNARTISCRKSYKKQLEEKIRNEAPGNEFLEGEIVLATIPGYAPWPAKIHQISNETIFVKFFGTGQV